MIKFRRPTERDGYLLWNLCSFIFTIQGIGFILLLLIGQIFVGVKPPTVDWYFLGIVSIIGLVSWACFKKRYGRWFMRNV